MRNLRIKSSNSTAVYIIAIIVIIIAFLLLGGSTWLKGMMHRGGSGFHGGQSINFANWDWLTILISLGVGILVGVLIMRRK